MNTERSSDTKPKKQINHRFLDRHTIPGALLLTLWGYVGAQVLLGGVLLLLLQLVLPADAASGFAIAIGALILLLIHKRWFYPEFEGCLPGRDFRPALPPLVLMLVAVWLPSVIQDAAAGALGAPTLAAISTALMAGIGEEVTFRGLPGSYLMRQWRQEEKIPVVMLLTSALFSLIHAFNLFVGAPLGATVVQLFVTFGFGLLLCAAFLRTGSLLPSMLLHVAHDIIGLLNIAYTDSGVMTGGMSVLAVLSNLVAAVLMGALGLYMTRPAKRKDILALWADKWGGADSIH